MQHLPYGTGNQGPGLAAVDTANAARQQPIDFGSCLLACAMPQANRLRRSYMPVTMSLLVVTGWLYRPTAISSALQEKKVLIIALVRFTAACLAAVKRTYWLVLAFKTATEALLPTRQPI